MKNRDKTVFSFRINRDLYTKISIMAMNNYRSINKEMEYILSLYVEDKERKGEFS